MSNNGDPIGWKPWYRRRWVWAVGAVLAVSALGNLTKKDKPSKAVAATTTVRPSTTRTTRAAATTAPTTSTVPATSAPPATTPPSKKPTIQCLAVPAELADAITGGVKAGVGGMTSRATGAVKSPDFKNVYFVAIKFSVPGASATGVWATNSMEAGGGLILAADAFAKEFTDWPNASKTDAQISGADPSIRLAKSCLP